VGLQHRSQGSIPPRPEMVALTLTAAASSWRMPPSQPRASIIWRGDPSPIAETT